MKSRYERFFIDFEKAIRNLETALSIVQDDLDIDGCIKRFELCYELSWKLIKSYLENLGIICRNPRECFKAAFINELIDIEAEWIAMIEDRNNLVHTYTFEQSRIIYDQIRSRHCATLKKLYQRISPEFSLDS